MAPAPLPRSLPEQQGVDSAGVLAFLDAMDAAADIELHSLMLIRHGHLVADGWWAPYAPQQPQLLYSLSKSFTSTAAAFAAAEGLLDLDDPVLAHFPEFDEEVTDPRSRRMLVRHIAAMASGHAAETVEVVGARRPQDPVLSFLQIPPDAEPGTLFAYNQPCTYTLAAIIQRESGQTLTEYLRTRLFDPLGIGDVGWMSDPLGRELGFSGFHATTGDIARLGLLYLQNGVWEGRQLIPASWVAEATRLQVANPEEENPDWSQGYGFQFWMARHGYRGDGAYGQFCVVLPEQDTVVAITSCTANMQGVLDALWEHLLPALRPDELPKSHAAGELVARMANLAIPATVADARPPAIDPPITFAPGSTDQKTITAVDLRRDGEGWELVLVEREDRLPAVVTSGSWTTSPGTGVGDGEGHSEVPIAASGGWIDADTFIADVIFLETPHRLSISCSLSTQTFDAHWPTVPLHVVRLADLRMPRPGIAAS